MVVLKVNPQARLDQASTSQKILKQYEDVAEGMEANFTNHMLSEMRKSVNKETPDSASMDYYNSLMDDEHSKMMAASKNGLGVKGMILDQILPQHLKQLRNPVAPQQQIAKYESVSGRADSAKEISHE